METDNRNATIATQQSQCNDRKKTMEEKGARKKTAVAKDAPPASSAERKLRVREVPAVRRAISILELLAKGDDGLNALRIARQLGMTPSTCLHILRELVASRLVALDESQKSYRLGMGVLGLASGLSAHDSFIRCAQPRLAQFAHDYTVSATAQQRDKDEILVVAAIAASEGLFAPVGKHAPVLSGSGGQLLAAHGGWTKAELRVRFNEVQWQNAPAFGTWLEDVEIADARGYAIDDGRYRLGITSISAPIPDRDGSVRRTVSINMVSAQITEKRRASLIRALQLLGEDITSALR